MDNDVRRSTFGGQGRPSYKYERQPVLPDRLAFSFFNTWEGQVPPGR
jgi:hypothetical protein